MTCNHSSRDTQVQVGNCFIYSVLLVKIIVPLEKLSKKSDITKIRYLFDKFLFLYFFLK